jgi:hypothetical protein
MFSNANAISVLQEVRRQLCQLLPIDKGAVGTALIPQDILAVLIAHRRMATGGELISQERNIAGGCPSNTHFQFLKRIFI